MDRSSVVIKLSATILLAFFSGGCFTQYPVYNKQGKKAPATQRPYTINGKTYYPIYSSNGYHETGVASWYGKKFHGRKTANGETFNMHALTAAHKTLPMNTMLLVRNLENGKETIVRINDRGPFSNKRIIDLSYKAAKSLGMINSGIAKTEIIALEQRTGTTSSTKRMQSQDFNKGSFYIQVGSFLNKDNAQKLARQFQAKGIKIIISPFTRNNKTYHRVRMYAGESLKLARQLEKKVLGSDFPGAFIIAR